MARKPPSKADPGVPTDIPVGAVGKGIEEDRVREPAYLIWVDEGAPAWHASLTIGCGLSGRSRGSPSLRADACWRP